MAVNLKGRSFLTLMDLTPQEIRYLLDLGHDLKRKRRSGICSPTLQGKHIVLLFEKTSTRTRYAGLRRGPPVFSGGERSSKFHPLRTPGNLRELSRGELGALGRRMVGELSLRCFSLTLTRRLRQILRPSIPAPLCGAVSRCVGDPELRLPVPTVAARRSAERERCSSADGAKPLKARLNGQDFLCSSG